MRPTSKSLYLVGLNEEFLDFVCELKNVYALYFILVILCLLCI